MATDTDICNIALLHLSQDIPIASLTNNNDKSSRVMNRVYAQARDYVLADLVWPFATKSVALAPVEEAPPIGWSYRYAYPADCANALSVCDEGGVRFNISRYSQCIDLDTYSRGFGARQSYDVVYGEQSTSIVTDLENAYLIYSSKVEDTSRYSAPFIEALSWRIAWMAAPSIKGELGLRLRNDLLQGYEMAKAKASANANNESRENAEQLSPSVAAGMV